MSVWFPRYIDSAVPLTKVQRKLARGRAWLKWRHNKWNLAIYFATVGCLLAAIILAMVAIKQVINSMMFGLMFVLSYIAGLVVTWLSYRLLQRFRFAPHYRRAVRDLGIDVCVGCGYWLHGLDDQIRECPECGWSRPPDAVSDRDAIPWDAEAIRSLAEVGYEPCVECGVLCKSQMKHCPGCGAKRERTSDRATTDRHRS